MAIPDYQTLMLPLLKRAALGEVRVLDAEKKVGEEFGLTPEERAQLLPSGKQRVLHNRAHWAKFYMMKAGLVTFPHRGTFVATDAGQELLAHNPTHINLDLLKEYPSFEEFYRAVTPPIPNKSRTRRCQRCLPRRHATPEDQLETAFRTINSALRTHLCSVFRKTLRSSLKMIVDLLVKMGYGGSRPDAAAQLGGSGDGGVDGVINEDRLGLDQIYVQAKRYTETVVGRPRRCKNSSAAW